MRQNREPGSRRDSAPLSFQEILSRVKSLRHRNTAGLRGLWRQLSNGLAAADRETVVRIATELVQSGHPEARFISYELVKYHPAARQSITAAEVERLGAGISDWGSVDCFGCYIAGAAWREGRIADER